MPQHFKLNNFTTLGGGKTFHPGNPKNWDEPRSWSQDEPYYDGGPKWVPPSLRGQGQELSTNASAKARGNTNACNAWPGSIMCPIVDDDDQFQVRLGGLGRAYICMPVS